jgi:transcriptional regulator with XRE-family HTH domain
VPTEDLVDRLIALRHEAKLTQRQLAQKLRISTASVALYETRQRRMPLAMAERWALACGAQLVHSVIRDGDIPEASLSDRERRLVTRFRRLHVEDQDLVDDLARGLDGGSRGLREMIAVQIPVLLASVHSGAEDPEQEEPQAKRS